MAKAQPQLLRGLLNIPPNFSGCVATIGNFDGIHLGHQALIAQLIQKSTELKLPSVLITFEPQPNEFFAQQKAPVRLMRLREKYLALQKFPVDYLLCLRFDKKMAALAPEEFVQKILVEKLKVKHVVVGDDFHFGHQRSGDIKTLQQAAQRWGFTAESMPTYKMHEERVSSSRVRLALQDGNLQAAKKLLGRDYFMAGRVVHGQKRGRIIGFPTANLLLQHRSVSLAGVYVVKILGLSDQPLPGVANIGTRPTVDGTRNLLETHIFDFDQDIYGKTICVEFIKKLRDEERFESFELLKQQIFKDAKDAREYFLNN